MVVPLSQLAYHFLAPELFALQMLGITAIVSLTGKNVLEGCWRPLSASGSR